MDLEQINSEFNKYSSKKINKAMQDLKTKIEDTKIEIEGKKSLKAVWENDLTKAKRQGNKTAEKQAESEIKKIEGEIKALQDKLKKMQKYIDTNKAKVEACIDAISQNPELKKHVEAQTKKRLVRRTEKALKENECLENIKALIEAEPACEEYISDMKDASIEWRKLDKEIEKEKNNPAPNAATIATKEAEIKSQRKIYYSKRDLIKKAAKKQGIEFNEEIFKKFIEETGFKKNKGTGKYDIKKVIDKKMAGNEKSIRNDELALSKIEGRTISIGLDNNNSLDEAHAEVESGKLPAVRDKSIKWYQFIKRFKNWKENRKNRKPKYESRKEYEDDSKQESSKEFKNAYKYDVVKEYAERYEKEIMGEAKKARKEEQER